MKVLAAAAEVLALTVLVTAAAVVHPVLGLAALGAALLALVNGG